MMMAADRDAMVAKIMSMHQNVTAEEAVEALRECNWASADEALTLLEQEKGAAKIAPTGEKNLKGEGDTKSRDTGGTGVGGGKKTPRPDGPQVAENAASRSTLESTLRPAPPASSLTMAVRDSGRRPPTVESFGETVAGTPGAPVGEPSPAVAESTAPPRATNPTSAPFRPRPPAPVAPGAVAVNGIDSRPGTIDDDYTVTAPLEDTAVVPADASEEPVVAELVHESLQQELERTRNENARMRMERDNAVVAQVVGNDEEEAADGSADEKEQGLSDSSGSIDPRRKWIIGGALLVLVGIVLGVAIPLSSKSSSPSTTTTASTPTTGPMEAPLEPTAAPTIDPSLVEFLTSISFDNGTALFSPDTPQNKAMIWLAGNANLDSYSVERKVQRFALATLYYSTGGDSWVRNAGWLSDGDECGDWHSDDTNPCINGTILKISLGSNNVFGPIPPELMLLTQLTGIWLLSNSLGGTIPTEIGRLTKLVSLQLRHNYLTGPLPTEIGLLTNLEWWLQQRNRHTGTIPTELNLMTALDRLDLSDNRLTGEFTCPTWPRWCFISCADDFDDLQDINSTCRSL